jgi:hypothetical protein
MTIQLSDYLVFADESGDHTLTPQDSEYPVFVLALLIISRAEYALAESRLQELKLKHCGRTDVVLHERKISKQKGDFTFLLDVEKRRAFFDDLNQLMQQLNYTIIATAIHKTQFAAQYTTCDNPYHLALEFCMERLKFFLRRRSQLLKTPIVFESRGKTEDAELKQAFLKFRAREHAPFTMDFALKKANIAGLQIANCRFDCSSYRQACAESSPAKPCLFNY